MLSLLDGAHKLASVAVATPLLLASLGASRALRAQTPDRVLHVWVDPLYGDDTLAVGSSANPNGTTWCSQTPQLPHDYRDPTQGNAVLLNASWPFKTVTAAISYIPPLPNASSRTPVVTWRYAIIHCLPGMYAAGLTYANSFYQSNGLRANGENFPIRLPDGVSIQGTSALNTVFHLDNQDLPQAAFQFCMQASGFSGKDSFIDKVSIFGVGEVEQFGAARAAAIYCGRLAKCELTLTNCFIFGNFVGVLLDAPTVDNPVYPADVWHQVKILNNTFAWNRCAIWNGESQDLNNSQGRSRVLALNNVFDSTSPITGTLPVAWPTFGNGAGTLARLRSCFEALAREDLYVANTGGSGGPTNRDFNAYEQKSLSLNPNDQGLGGFNWGQQGLPVGFLPVTVTWPVTFNQPPNVPQIDLSPITGSLSQDAQGNRDGKRGTLYIRDLMENGSQTTNNYFNPSSNFDKCPGDFRISPGEAAFVKGATTTPNTPQAKHRLVDAGWAPTTGASAFPVTMQNGMTLATWPGYLTLNSQSTWQHHTWESDCEGFANPRFFDHPNYDPVVQGGPPGYGGADIGADELHGLVIPGPRFATTHLASLSGSNLPDQGVLPMDNKYLWYLGIPGALTVTAHRPYYRWVNPTTNAPWSGLWNWAPGASLYYFPQLIQITPHLLNDIHPYWAQYPPLVASNPIWQHCLTNPPYNQSLSWDPTYGVINPPGTWPVIQPSLVPFQWLDGLAVTGKGAFVRLPAYGGPNFWTRFDSWCAARLATTTPRFSTFPATFTGGTITGLRYSVEHPWEHSPAQYLLGPSWTRQSTPGVDSHNVQSFLVVVEAR